MSLSFGFKQDKMVLLFALLAGLLFAQDDIEYIDSESCVDCHEESYTGSIIEDDIGVSIHAGMECLDCHQDKDQLPHDEDSAFIVGCESCRSCHEDVSDEYQTHGNAVRGECEDMPQCHDCHGEHLVLPSDDPGSTTYPKKLANTCGNCHARPELVAKYNIPDLHPVELFSKSFHAKELGDKDNLLAATCNDCHGVHNIKIATDPTSTISHSNIAETCGNCHKEIYAKYSKSVHWEALARGERESASCVDCHGEHEIVGHEEPGSMVSKRSSAEKTCARCHTDEHMIRKYGLSAGKVSSYQDSYHGLAVLKGDKKAATCYNCHNPHEILSVSDPNSSIHPNNLKETCSSCHPGASDNFAQAYTHKSVIMAEKPVEYYVKVVYIILIVVVIGGMFLHNLLLFSRAIILKYQKHSKSDYIQRYSASEVMQHRILLLSFFALVFTGFALKYPGAWWVEGLTWVGLTESLRGLIHRISAVVMILLSVWHTIEIISTRRGRRFIKDFVPGLHDFKHFYAQMLYSLRISDKEPEFERFDYAEKAEYWALIWGTIVMVVTGFVLWFPVYFANFTPLWFIKVSEVFHLYEAWLATLAIIVWHFYFVMIRPSEYPMNMTWIKGRMPIEAYKHHHPADFRRIMDEIDAYKNGLTGKDTLSFQAREYVERHQINVENN